MKLSLNQTKELLERVERKINLQEDIPNPGSGLSMRDALRLRNTDKEKKMRKNTLADLRRKASDIIENNRKAKERLPDDIEEVIDKIRKMEDVTKEEISKLDLSSSVGDDIISLIQTYAEIVLGEE